MSNNNIVKELKKTFFNLNNREPMDSEIIGNLQEKIELSILQKIINEQKNTDSVAINIDHDD